MRAEDVPSTESTKEKKKFESCVVFDAAYHPRATYLARQSDRFMVFLVEIAVENINGTESHRKE
eukprot:gene16648-52907_t